MEKKKDEPTDRKFKPQSTPTQYGLNPPSSSTTLCSPQPTINFSSKTALFGVRRDLMRVTGGKCTMPATRILQTTPLTAPSQRLVHTNPRSAACASSTAQDYHPNVWSNSSSGKGELARYYPVSTNLNSFPVGIYNITMTIYSTGETC